MAKNKVLIAVALASLLGSGAAVAAEGKCWSTKDFTVVKGANACKSAVHSCKAQSAADDNSGQEFVVMTEKQCMEKKGKFSAK